MLKKIKGICLSCLPCLVQRWHHRRIEVFPTWVGPWPMCRSCGRLLGVTENCFYHILQVWGSAQQRLQLEPVSSGRPWRFSDQQLAAQQSWWIWMAMMDGRRWLAWRTYVKRHLIDCCFSNHIAGLLFNQLIISSQLTCWFSYLARRLQRAAIAFVAQSALRRPALTWSPGWGMRYMNNAGVVSFLCRGFQLLTQCFKRWNQGARWSDPAHTRCVASVQGTFWFLRASLKNG